MSIKSFISKTFSNIAKLFNGLQDELKSAVHIGAVVTEAIKTFDVNNPVAADVLTALIPGDLDDKVKQLLRKHLPGIAIELRLVDATCKLSDPNEIMLSAVKVIQQLEGDYSNAFLHNLSIIVAQVAADGKLDWKDAVYLLQWYYDNNVKQ